jgi:hypothetical protein
MALTRVQGGVWGAGGGANTAFQTGVAIMENANTVYNSYTLTTNNNAMSVGPITILTGKAITVPTGQKWIVL